MRLRLDPQQKEHRRKAQADLFWFAHKVLRYPDLYEPLHRGMSEFWQHPASNKLGLWPRGHFKSTLFSIAAPLWEIIRCVDANVYEFPPRISMQILLAGENEKIPVKFLESIAWHVASNTHFKELFPEIKRGRPWRMSARANIERKFDPILKESTLEIMGGRGNPTSPHYNLIVEDDIVGFTNYNTQEGRDHAWNWHVACSPLMLTGARRYVVCTRWDIDDVAGRIIERNETLPVEEQYYIENHSCFNDEGDSIFPPVWPVTRLEAERSNCGEVMFCTPYETPILMADWSTKPIGEVDVGDIVIGFEMGRGRPGEKDSSETKLVRSEVKKVHHHVGLTQKVYLESGRVIRCTPEHKWYTGRTGSDSHKPYRAATIGSSLLEIVDTDDDGKSYDYLAGIIDGEGSCKGHAIYIFQCPRANPEVYARIKAELESLGLPYGISKNDKTGKPIFFIKGGRQSSFRVLQGNPAKSQQIIDGMWQHPCKMARRRDRIVKIEADDEYELVFGLTTTTGNYVAWGYASANSNWYLNDPIPQRGAGFNVKDVKYWQRDAKFVRILEDMPTAIVIDPNSEGTGPNADYTGILVVGVYDGNYYVLVAMQVRESWNAVVRRAVQLARVHHPFRIAVEAQSTQKPILGLFEAEYRKGLLPQVMRLQTSTATRVGLNAGKHIRIMALGPYFENGRIWVHRSQTELIDQIVRYPKTRHNDLLDTLGYVPEVLPSAGGGGWHGGVSDRPVATRRHIPGQVVVGTPDDDPKQPFTWGWM